MTNPPAWHPDPTGRHEHRYWDGERWTDHVADAGQASTDPVDGGSQPSTAEQPTSGDGQDAGSEEAGSQQPAAAPIEPEPTPSSPARPTFATSSPPPMEGDGPPGSHDTGPGTSGGQPPSGHTGSSVSPGSSFPAASPAPGQTAQGGGNTPAVIALILGIIALLTCWTPLMGIIAGRPVVATIGVVVGVLSVLAIVFGIKGRSRAKESGGGSGMAVTGIVTGALAVAGTLFFMGLGIFFSGFTGEFGNLVECIEETGDEEFCQEQFERGLLERFGQ